MVNRLEAGFLHTILRRDNSHLPLHDAENDLEKLLEATLVLPGGAVERWLSTNGLSIQIANSDKNAQVGLIVVEDRIVELAPEGIQTEIVFRIPNANMRIGINFCYLDTYLHRQRLKGMVGKLEDFVDDYLVRSDTKFYARYLEKRNEGLAGIRIFRRLEGLMRAMIEDGLIPTLEPTDLKRYDLYRHFIERKSLEGSVVIRHPHRYATMR